MARQHLEPGRRVSLRRVRPDGEQGDLVGFVLASDPAGLVLRDRRGVVHSLAWDHVLACRPVGVARGRDPVRTPLAELDRLAAAAGVSGRVFVARLSALLDPRPPVPLGAPSSPPPAPATLDGEWVTAARCADVIALAWWATHRDARSIQVRTDDPAAAAELLALGFTERTRP